MNDTIRKRITSGFMKNFKFFKKNITILLNKNLVLVKTVLTQTAINNIGMNEQKIYLEILNILSSSWKIPVLLTLY